MKLIIKDILLPDTISTLKIDFFSIKSLWAKYFEVVKIMNFGENLSNSYSCVHIDLLKCELKVWLVYKCFNMNVNVSAKG